MAACAAALVGAAVAYFVIQDIQSPDTKPKVSDNDVARKAAPAAPSQPSYVEIISGATLEWTADSSPDEVMRSVGPYTVRVTKKLDDGLVAPAVTVSAGGQSVRLEGNALSPNYSHSISAVRNRAGAAPVVMLQSFSGGAHCCHSVQLAGFSSGRLVRVDLGSWDGGTIETPQDLSGDGVADFVFNDNGFLYAFAGYAKSYSPPVIFNVLQGKAVDVSKNPAFRKLYSKSMDEAGKTCRSGDDGTVRNGACPAYVASAARLGKLSEAWAHMLAAYDASTDWELPTGCLVDDSLGCPEGSRVYFKSYPEALLYFLKEQGYVQRRWQPPEMFRTTPGNQSGEHDADPIA